MFRSILAVYTLTRLTMVTDPTVSAMDPDTMTLEELAHRMGISLTVAYELARRNALPVPVIRVGRQYRFSRQAYDVLMSGQHPSRVSEAH